MKRPWLIWTLFAACLAVLLSAMGWVSVTAWRLERAEAQARRQTELEEKMRLALWRLDSALAPMLAQESVRPYFVYSPLLTIERAFGRMFNDRDGSEPMTPSPLLTRPQPHVRVYFQFGPDGAISSPQVPVDGNHGIVVPRYVQADAVKHASDALNGVQRLVSRERLLTLLPEHPPAQMEIVLSPLNPPTEENRYQQQRRRSELQHDQGQMEYSMRNMAVQQSANTMALNYEQQQLFNDAVAPPTDVSGVLMTPLWIDDELLLARRVSVNGSEYVQGCLLDWPGLRASLLETIEDLLPAADLVAAASTEGQQACMLAALPVALRPGVVAAGPEPSAMLVWLGVAWTGMILAALAVAGLLAGVLRLSERRASFVTAVTHELRTPLTTFQMYAEMLAEGMVTDPAQRQLYLNTLRTEAIRLTHMVENVLAFARLERGANATGVQTLPLADLVGPMIDRLSARAEQGSMRWVVNADPVAATRYVRANVAAVEHILFNLVDNACKYASTSQDRRIELGFSAAGATAQVTVRDYGPGIDAEIRRRLFTPFSKTAQQAAHTAPGVGLGLALSRRLARDMGGDLRSEPVATGARFVLTLPTAS